MLKRFFSGTDLPKIGIPEFHFVPTKRFSCSWAHESASQRRAATVFFTQRSAGGERRICEMAKLHKKKGGAVECVRIDALGL